MNTEMLSIVSLINLELIAAHEQGDENQVQTLSNLLNKIKLMMLPVSGPLHQDTKNARKNCLLGNNSSIGGT